MRKLRSSEMEDRDLWMAGQDALDDWAGSIEPQPLSFLESPFPGSLLGPSVKINGGLGSVHGNLSPVQAELGRCQQAVPRGWEMGDTLCCLSRLFLLLLIPNPHLTELSICFLLKRWVTPILQRGAKKAQKSYFLMPQVIQLWITGSQMCVKRILKKKKKNYQQWLKKY